MTDEFNMLFESILDDIDSTDSSQASQNLADSTTRFNNSIWLMRDSQIISVFNLNTSKNTPDENKEIIRKTCYGLYEDMFDTVEQILESTPLVKNDYELSFVYLDTYPSKTETIEQHIMEEYTKDEWMKICTDWWLQYDIYFTPCVAIRIKCNVNRVSFNTFRREFCLLYRKTTNSCKLLIRATIYVTDDNTNDMKMILTTEQYLPEQLINGYMNLYNESQTVDDSQAEHHKKRSQRKIRSVQNFIYYLVWLEKITKKNPEENLQFEMDGIYHKWSQFSQENVYQFIFKITPKDGTYRLDDLKQFIYTKFLKGIERYGFRPWDSSKDIEIYIFEGGAFMTDDMKRNPMELGTVEINGHTLTLKLGFLDSSYERYPCGRTKNYHKLDNAHQMWQQWMSCRSGRQTFF